MKISSSFWDISEKLFEKNFFHSIVPPYLFIESLSKVNSLNWLLGSMFLPNFNFLGTAVLEILSLQKRLGGPGRVGLGRAGPGRAGSGRAGPCHIKNGFYMKKEEFWYQSDLSTIIFEGFRSCLFSPYTCRISSLTLAIIIIEWRLGLCRIRINF